LTIFAGFVVGFIVGFGFMAYLLYR